MLNVLHRSRGHKTIDYYTVHRTIDYKYVPLDGVETGPLTGD